MKHRFCYTVRTAEGVLPDFEKIKISIDGSILIGNENNFQD